MSATPSHHDTSEHELSPFCPVFHRAVELVGRRWTAVIVRALLTGSTRFSEISAVVPGLSDRLLSERLKELEGEGIVQREVFPETPVRIEYHLTEKGRALAGVVEEFERWAEAWGAAEAPARAKAGARKR